MALLRDIAMPLARNDILLISTWISIKANQLTDDLSRFRMEKVANVYS